MKDVQIIDQGTLVGFRPTSDAAKNWFLNNVQSEDWQWLGSTLWVDFRMVRTMLEGIVNADLTVEVA